MAHKNYLSSSWKDFCLHHRIVALNVPAPKMGILGELPKEEMLKKLQGEVAKQVHTRPDSRDETRIDILDIQVGIVL